MKRVFTSLIVMLMLFAVGAQADRYTIGTRIQGISGVSDGTLIIFEAASSTGNYGYYIKESSSGKYLWAQGFSDSCVWKAVSTGTANQYSFQNTVTGNYMAGTRENPVTVATLADAGKITIYGKDQPWAWQTYSDQVSNPTGWDDNSIILRNVTTSEDWWLANDVSNRESGAFPNNGGLHNWCWNAWTAVSVVDTLSQVSDLRNDRAYILTCERGKIVANAAGTAIVTAANAAASTAEGADQWALLTLNEQGYYLYNVAAKKFLNAAGALDGSASTAITVQLATTPNAGYIFKFTNGANTLNVNSAGNAVLDDWSTEDAGNRFSIVGVNTFDPNIFSTPATIVWNVVDGQNNVVATDTVKGYVGNEYTTSLASYEGVTLATPSVTPASADTTITTTFTIDDGAFPFKFTAANDTAWYQIGIRSTKYLHYSATDSHVKNTATAATLADEDLFAMVGTPFGFNLINRAAGADKPFGPATATDNMKLVAGDKADAATLIYQNNNGHQVFRFLNAGVGYVNDVNSELGVWLSGAGATDGGSTLSFTEVNPNDVPAVITWNIVDGEGNTVLTETINGYVGKTYDASVVNTDGTAFGAIPGLVLTPATITADSAVYTATSTYTFDESAYSFKFSTNADDATWYSLKIRGSNILSVNTDGTINSRSTAPAEETDGKYLFAFVGDPLGFNIVNYSLGFDAPFGPASAASSPKLVSGDKASAATFIFGHSCEKGYESYNLIRYADDKLGYLNDVNGSLAVWSSINNRHDNGSNFTFTEVSLPVPEDSIAVDSITDGYYRIVSADSAFGTTSYAISVVNNALVWTAEDATDAKQIFQLTNTNDPYTDGGGVHQKFNTYNPASGLYIGNSPSWGNTAPTLSATVWQTCFTLINDSTVHSQWAVQPWHTNMLSQCLAPDDDTTTGGSLVQKTWYENVKIGSNCAWVLKKVSDENALNLLEGDIANSLDGLIAKCDSVQLDTTSAPGYYVAANVKALAGALTSAKAVQQGTIHERYLAANALTEAYNKATSEYQPITEGYYYLVSAYAAYETAYGAPAAIYTAPGASLRSNGAHPAMYDKFDAQNANYIFHLTAKDSAAGKWNVQNAYTGWYLNTGNGDSWYGEVTTISDSVQNAQIFHNYQLGNFWVADETDTNVSRAVRRGNATTNPVQNSTVYGWTTMADVIADADKWFNAWKLVPVSSGAAEQIIAAQAKTDSITAKERTALQEYVAGIQARYDSLVADTTIDSTIVNSLKDAMALYTTSQARRGYDVVTDSTALASIRAAIENALTATEEHIEYYDSLLVLANNITTTYTIGTGLGQYTATDSLTAALDAARALTAEARDNSKNAEYEAAYTALQAALAGGLTLNLPTAGTFITLKNRVSGGYLTSEAASADNQATSASAGTASAAQIWYYTTGTDGKGQLVSYYSGEFLNVNWQTQINQPGLGASGTTIYGYAEYPGTYCIYVPSGGWAHGYANADGTIGATKGASMTGEQYAWEIEAVSELPVSLNQYGTEGYYYATVNLPTAFVVTDEDVTPYAVGVNYDNHSGGAPADSTIGVWELNSDTIAANTPVLLVSKEQLTSTSLTILGEGGTTLTSNLLQGVTTATQQNSEGLYLGQKDDKVGFYATDNSGYLAFQGYLPVSAASAFLVNGGVAISLDKITGISSASTGKANGLDLSKPVYNVQGQRVSATYKGIVIQNGKKYILK